MTFTVYKDSFQFANVSKRLELGVVSYSFDLVIELWKFLIYKKNCEALKRLFGSVTFSKAGNRYLSLFKRMRLHGSSSWFNSTETRVIGLAWRPFLVHPKSIRLDIVLKPLFPNDLLKVRGERIKPHKLTSICMTTAAVFNLACSNRKLTSVGRLLGQQAKDYRLSMRDLLRNIYIFFVFGNRELTATNIIHQIDASNGDFKHG